MLIEKWKSKEYTVGMFVSPHLRGEEVGDGGFLLIVLGLACINIHETKHSTHISSDFIPLTSNSNSLISYELVICPDLQANGKYYMLSVLAHYYLCSLKCMFSQKKHPSHLII